MVFEKLLEPGRIGTLELKNRIIMPPMGTRLCGQWGEVTDSQIEWYVRRAQGGVGLIVVEESHAATALDPVRYHTRCTRADDDSYFPGLFKLAEAVHDAGAKIGINLTVGKGLTASSGPWAPLGQEYLQENVLVSPSAIPAWVGDRKVRALTIPELEKMVELIGHASRRVKQVGFDAIEINAHAGYIVSEFLSPYFNQRKDKYGGSLDGRLRLLLEIIDSVRANVGPDFPLIVKYAVEERIEGGLEIKEGQVIGKRLQQRGVNAISVSMGTFGSKIDVAAPYYYPEGYTVHLAEALKKTIQIPVYVSGQLGNPSLAEQVIREEKADFIGLGRPLIADPDWVKKISSGCPEEIRMCLACNDCFRVPFILKGSVRCAVNATAGREREYGTLVPTRKPKRIFIVGAGPAGMEAARVIASRGHSVTLYERTNVLGGQLKFASMPPHKEVIKRIINYYSEIFRKLKNVEIKLETEVTAHSIIDEKPDAAIIATGGEPFIPNIPGIDKPNVINVFDLLTEQKRAGKTVVVVGGGSIGCEIANLLAQQGKKVTIVEMLEAIATDMDIRIWRALSHELSKYEVRIMTGEKIETVTEEGPTLIDKQGTKTVLKADTIVLACGMKPVNTLVKQLVGKIEEVFVIGDANQPKTIRNAISDGYVLAYRI